MRRGLSLWCLWTLVHISYPCTRPKRVEIVLLTFRSCHYGHNSDQNPANTTLSIKEIVRCHIFCPRSLASLVQGLMLLRYASGLVITLLLKCYAFQNSYDRYKTEHYIVITKRLDITGCAETPIEVVSSKDRLNSSIEFVFTVTDTRWPALNSEGSSFVTSTAKGATQPTLTETLSKKFTFTSQWNNVTKRRAGILSLLASLTHAYIHTSRTRFVKKIPSKCVLFGFFSPLAWYNFHCLCHAYQSAKTIYLLYFLSLVTPGDIDHTG